MVQAETAAICCVKMSISFLARVEPTTIKNGVFLAMFGYRLYPSSVIKTSNRIQQGVSSCLLKLRLPLGQPPAGKGDPSAVNRSVHTLGLPPNHQKTSPLVGNEGFQRTTTRAKHPKMMHQLN